MERTRRRRRNHPEWLPFHPDAGQRTCEAPLSKISPCFKQLLLLPLTGDIVSKPKPQSARIIIPLVFWRYCKGSLAGEEKKGIIMGTFGGLRLEMGMKGIETN